jgi:hypothetical protein
MPVGRVRGERHLWIAASCRLSPRPFGVNPLISRPRCQGAGLGLAALGQQLVTALAGHREHHGCPAPNAHIDRIFCRNMWTQIVRSST